MIDKGVCDKGYAWNPTNCECEFDNVIMWCWLVFRLWKL